MTDSKKNMPAELTEDQLEEVIGGAGVTIRLMSTTHFLKCAVDPRHVWPNGALKCPVCGSTRSVRANGRSDG